MEHVHLPINTRIISVKVNYVTQLIDEKNKGFIHRIILIHRKQQEIRCSCIRNSKLFQKIF